MKIKFPRGVEVVGSAIIENEEGKILLTQSPNWNNKWTFPGGHIEPGEKISEGITREVEEEVGLKVELIDVIAQGELIDSKDFHRPAHFIYFTLYYKVASHKVKLNGIELKDFKWLTPTEALEYDLADVFLSVTQKFIKYKKLTQTLKDL